MNIKNQVCTSQQGKTLSDLGVKSELANFSHCVIMPDILGQITLFEVLYNNEDPKTLVENIAPAFTVAELGAMLGTNYPSWSFETEENEVLFVTTCIAPNEADDSDKENVFYTYSEFDRLEETEAQSRAALLIDLMANEIPGYSVDEVNKRLTES